MKVWVGTEHILKEVCRAQGNTLSLGLVEEVYMKEQSSRPAWVTCEALFKIILANSLESWHVKCELDGGDTRL